MTISRKPFSGKTCKLEDRTSRSTQIRVTAATACVHTFTWSNQDLVFLGSDAEEGEVILGVNVPDGVPGLLRQLGQEARILNSCGVVQCGPDGNT